MLRVKYTFFSLGILLALCSCKKENAYDCFKSSGPTETRIREIHGFNRIVLNDKIDLFISQGEKYEVKVEAGKNLQANIRTEVSDSILTISNHNKCNFVRSAKKRLRVYVTLPDLNYLETNGVGSTYFNNRFSGDTLHVKITNSGDTHLDVDMYCIKTSSHGNGDIYVQGDVVKSFNYLNGTNYLHMEESTIKDYIFIESYSIGHCYVNAPSGGGIDATLWRNGNIYYKGNPATINVQRYEKGTVIKQE